MAKVQEHSKPIRKLIDEVYEDGVRMSDEKRIGLSIRARNALREIERVLALKDGNVAVPVLKLKSWALAISSRNDGNYAGDVVLRQMNDILRSFLPAPPTAEELESALRAVCADDGEDVALSFARARWLLERADAARKGGA